ncbi:LacI family DNA-binding transcriptional regulator [Devosia sp. FKR38]|uniref:LacI family DNA-binding transcriptional regulator n=1 Tax=Devosia sp. FKR38 TaxID=2562312 RepID=UPI0020BEC418|nr:LacI family DNA-binding transcriptional regulator [Devosia sp. FKR38]
MHSRNADKSAKKQPTIVEVAEAAGVAIGTVSRYLNGLPVRGSNRAPIEKAISELGYRRNMVAVSMKRQTTHIVGFMVPALSEFHSGLLDQLTRRMRRTGRAVLCYSHDMEARSIEEGLEFFASHRVDAVVMDGVIQAQPALERYIEDGLTVVLYDNDVPGLSADRVFSNNRKASERMVNHLIDLGHTRIATIHGSEDNSAGQERLQGYTDAMERHGLAMPDAYVTSGYWSEEGGHAAIRDLMALAEPPTAVFSANYNMTIGALRWLREHDLDVPNDLSLVSFDDVPAFAVHRTGITAVGQSIDQLADSIATVLLERLEAGPQSGRRTLRIDANIILRGSARSPKTIVREERLWPPSR